MIVPLYRLQGHGDHFYTTSAQERDNAIAQYGYVSEGIACYVNDSPTDALTLRDQLAMSALGSIVLDQSYHHPHPITTVVTTLADDLAAKAYVVADAMLRAR